ncbi:kinetochore component CENP-S-domain-containing protein [Dichotomocladium elegans]|nr:kinetochore component CENP-S-domain-containing protein [Dichotomocladium elegans]
MNNDTHVPRDTHFETTDDGNDPQRALKTALWRAVDQIARAEGIYKRKTGFCKRKDLKACPTIRTLFFPAAAIGKSVSHDFVASLAHVVYSQAETMALDLEAFARHARRSTIAMDDVKVCMDGLGNGKRKEKKVGLSGSPP